MKFQQALGCCYLINNGMNSLLRLLSILLFAVSTTVFADLKCDVDLQYGFIVNAEHIRVVDEHITRYQINADDQLIVGGHWITLNEQQQADIKALSDGVHEVMPKMTLLAVEGVKLAVDTIEHVYVGLVGRDHKTYEKVQNALHRVKKKVSKKFIHVGDNYYIGPGNLESVDEFVDQELEEELEQAIDTSVGGVLSAIAGLSSSNDEEMEQRIDELSQRLELLGEQMDSQVAPRANTLRKKAHWFCKRMKKLNEIEERLRESIPELQPYDAIHVGD